MKRLLYTLALSTLGAACCFGQFSPVINTTYGADNVCALHTDTTPACANSTTDGTTETAFASTVTIPAGALASNSVTIVYNIGSLAGGATPTGVFKIRAASVSGTTLFTSPTITPASGSGTELVSCNFTSNAAAGASVGVVVSCSPIVLGAGLSVSMRNTTLSNTTLSVALPTNAAIIVVPTMTYSANTTGNVIWINSASMAVGSGPVINAHPLMQLTAATTPTLSTCGTSPTLSADSVDNKGTVTLGTGTVNSCTVTFGTAFTNAPSVQISTNSPSSAPAYISAVSTTAFTITFPYTGATYFKYTAF